MQNHFCAYLREKCIDLGLHQINTKMICPFYTYISPAETHNVSTFVCVLQLDTPIVLRAVCCKIAKNWQLLPKCFR